MTKRFDVFVSYKSEDAAEAERLASALRRRGVRVWLDKDRIRPGDRFAEVLEDGLATSRSVAMVITAESLRSNWVKDEYYRALSLANEGTLQLLPLLFGDAKLPGFLASRQYVDFRTGSDFERNVDRLVWPGITGKAVTFVAIYPGIEDFFDPSGYDHLRHLVPWYQLYSRLTRMGIQMVGGEDVHRARWRIARLRETSPTRIVAVIDPFEGWPAATFQRNTPQEYVDFIFETRRRTKNSGDEIVFLLFHHSSAWEKADHSLSEATTQRLRHYFALHTDGRGVAAEEEFERMWRRIQQELLKVEGIPADT